MIFGKQFNRYYLKYALPLLVGILTLVAVDFFQLIIPNLYQMVVNGLNQGWVLVDGVRLPFDMDFVVDRVCMPGILVIVSLIVGRFVWRVCFFGMGIQVEEKLRDKMFDNARNLSQRYYQAHKVGGLMSLFTNDLDTVQECFGWGIMMLFDAVLLTGMSMTKMFRMNWLLTLFSLIPTLLLLASATVVGRYMMKKWDVRQEAFSRLSDFSQESFSGMAVIKAFVKEARELMAFRKLNDENEIANVEHTRASVLMRVLVTLFVESVICIILGYGGYLVWKGTFNAGQLVEFIGYFTTIIWPVMAVSELIDMTSRGRASLKRIGSLLDAKPEVVDAPGAEPLEQVRGEIACRNLTFRYPGGEYDVLRNVSFRIEAGENVGLVGRTGCGKTTLADLILRTYNVPEGALFVDGRDVNRVTIRSLRAACAYVPQDNYLFSETIANNIAFAVDDYTQAQVEEAATLADLYSKEQEFHQGYDTLLGERGVTVSGGQKQRISIARALMKRAPILILDDSVSAVDTRTERVILDNLRRTRKGLTTLLIAHRISTIREMDKLLYMEDGQITAVGTHAELYEQCPGYRKMVDLQRLEEEGGTVRA